MLHHAGHHLFHELLHVLVTTLKPLAVVALSFAWSWVAMAVAFRRALA